MFYVVITHFNLYFTKKVIKISFNIHHTLLGTQNIIMLFLVSNRLYFVFWINAMSIFIPFHTTKAENSWGLRFWYSLNKNFMKWHSFKIKTEINTLFILHCLARKKNSRFLVYYLFFKVFGWTWLSKMTVGIIELSNNIKTPLTP